MKLCVLLIFALLPWIAWVGDWVSHYIYPHFKHTVPLTKMAKALRWTEGSEALQITFVMFVFPVIMNAIQYYIIDSFIKDKSASDHQLVPSSDSDADERDDHDTTSDDGRYESQEISTDSDRLKSPAGFEAREVDDGREELEDKDSAGSSASVQSGRKGKGIVRSRRGS